MRAFSSGGGGDHEGEHDHHEDGKDKGAGHHLEVNYETGRLKGTVSHTSGKQVKNDESWKRKEGKGTTTKGQRPGGTGRGTRGAGKTEKLRKTPSLLPSLLLALICFYFFLGLRQVGSRFSAIIFCIRGLRLVVFFLVVTNVFEASASASASACAEVLLQLFQQLVAVAVILVRIQALRAQLERLLEVAKLERQQCAVEKGLEQVRY